MSNGPPYRPPCAGWDDAKKKLEGCFSHHSDADNSAPEFPEGWPRYINQTKIDKVTDEFGDPIPDPPDRVCPYEVPRCWDVGMLPPFCLNNAPEREENIYAIANGVNEACDGSTPAASTVEYASCRKYGFKNVQARKAWHGRFGFNHLSSMLSDTKYLTKSVTSTLHWDYFCAEGDLRSIDVSISRVFSVGRYTGAIASSCSESVTGDTDASDCGQCSNDPDLGQDAYDRADFYTGVDTVEGEFVFDTDPITVGPCPGATGSTYSGTITKTNTEIRIHIEHVQDIETSTCQAEVCVYNEVLDVVIQLSGQYTAGQLEEDVEGLLAWWDLDDDVVYPWRTDVQPAGAPPCTTEPCSGPAYMPLVTYDETAPRSPNSGSCLGDTPGGTGAILGRPVHVHLDLPNRGGNDPYWDSLHPNYAFVSTGGGDCFRLVSWGNYAPDWCPSATQWTELFSYSIFEAGAWVAYNKPEMVNGDDCVVPDGFLQGYLVKTKWAETVYFEKQSHNYARPCGPTDQATVDPDTMDCSDDGFGGYVNPDQLQFPDAPASCEDIMDTVGGEGPYLVNDTDKKGDFCIKSWTYNYRYEAETTPTPILGAMVSMTCAQVCAEYSPCHPSVVYIQHQDDVPDRPGAIHVVNPSAPPLDEIYGCYALRQSHMHMIDPLWKQPRFPCPDGTLDLDAVTPIEECRDCGDGTCDDYVDRVNGGSIAANARCEPGIGSPWAEVEVEAP